MTKTQKYTKDEFIEKQNHEKSTTFTKNEGEMDKDIDGDEEQTKRHQNYKKG